MAKRQVPKQIQLEYCPDRLAKRKLCIVYEFLIPIHTCSSGDTYDELIEAGELCHVDGRHLYESFFRETKGRKNDR